MKAKALPVISEDVTRRLSGSVEIEPSESLLAYMNTTMKGFRVQNSQNQNKLQQMKYSPSSTFSSGFKDVKIRASIQERMRRSATSLPLSENPYQSQGTISVKELRVRTPYLDKK